MCKERRVATTTPSSNFSNYPLITAIIVFTIAQSIKLFIVLYEDIFSFFSDLHILLDEMEYILLIQLSALAMAIWRIIFLFCIGS